MLDQIEKINWASFEYPNMSNWLRALASNNETEREQAYNALFDNRVNYLSDASPHVVIFLTELLTHDIQDKNGVLSLLMQITQDAAAYLPDERFTQVAQDVLGRVTESIDIYLPFLDIDDTRAVTLHLIEHLKSVSNLTVPRLMQLFGESKSDQGKVHIILTLGTIIGESKELHNHEKSTERLLGLLATEENPKVRTASAISVINILGGNAPMEAEQIVVQALSNSPAQPQLGFPSSSGLISSIQKLGSSRAVWAFIKVLPDLRNEYDVTKVVPILLELAFNNGEVIGYSLTWYKHGKTMVTVPAPHSAASKPVGELNDLQKEVLEAMLKNNILWEFQTNVFELHGLPNTREKISEMLN